MRLNVIIVLTDWPNNPAKPAKGFQRAMFRTSSPGILFPSNCRTRILRNRFLAC
ncbi:unnamed protein product [Periconia digitata]|uniref:Uncharacterized protein n=1 Tax=Periconia digitata TaxID=1303443 RepID=A0A9W4XJ61_9PLEO|nr:unnamed protein product [Periconia digitata]